MADADVVLTAEQVLALIQRTTDENWFNAMMAQPDGKSLLLATAAMGAALSQCLDEQVAACKISEATTGSQGVCTLVIHRDSTTATGTIRQGFTFVTSIGVELAVSTTVAVSAGQATVTLPLLTLRQIDLVNKRESAFDDTLDPGDYLDAIISPESITVLDDNGSPLLGVEADVFTYVSSSSIVGATMDWLSEHGNERGCRRQPGEDGEAYRERVRQIPDAVTPTAIQEAIHGAQSKAELPTAYMVEPYRDQASDAARANLSLLFADGPACDEGFSDDPFGKNLAGKLPLRTHEAPGLREGRAYFRESIVGPLIEPNGLFMYEGYSFCDDPAWGYPDVGMHPYLLGGLRSIVDEARAKRAGGVQFDVMIENAKVLHDQDSGIGPIETVLWTMEAAADKFWLIREGLVTCDVNGQAIDPLADAFAIRITLEDGTVLTSEWITDPCGLPFRCKQMEAMGYFAQWVAKIEGLVRSAIRAPAAAVFAHGGCGPYLFDHGWTQTSPGTWTCDTAGTGALEDFIDDVELVKGMRLIAWHESLPEGDWPHTGIYTVENTGLDDDGHTLTHAVLKRAIDADTAIELETGAVVRVTGGTVYGGKVLRLTTQAPITLGTTPLYWELLTSYPRAEVTNLLNLIGTFWVTERTDP